MFVAGSGLVDTEAFGLLRVKPLGPGNSFTSSAGTAIRGRFPARNQLLPNEAFSNRAPHSVSFPGPGWTTNAPAHTGRDVGD